MSENTVMTSEENLVQNPEQKSVKKPEQKSEKKKKSSWFKNLKAEFKKIIWPDKKTLAKQTVAVTVCSILLGAIISVIDALIQYGIDFIVK